MRILSMLTMIGLVAAAPAAAQSCGQVPDGPKRLYDRSWIRSNAVLYGTDARGLFKLRLGGNAILRIGTEDGARPEFVRLSPMKRWLEYEGPGPDQHWLYGIAEGHEHKAGVRSAGRVQFVFSPGESHVAWLEREGDAHRIAVLDLKTFETLKARLLNAPDPKAIFFDLTWSADGNRLTYAWRDAEREEFYSVELTSGLVRSLPPPREFAADEFVETAYLMSNESDPSRIGAVQAARPGKDRIALDRGAVVEYRNRTIAVSMSKKRARTIAEVPVACGAALALLDAFDGRYVLYRTGDTYWIYGLRENRKAILLRGSGLLEW